jgi:hypothetical protein
MQKHTTGKKRQGVCHAISATGLWVLQAKSVVFSKKPSKKSEKTHGEHYAGFTT